MELSDIIFKDIKVPAAPGSLMRAVQLQDIGKFRISRRDAELYSVQVTSAGAWAHVHVFNGRFREIFHMCSAFTGSFWLGAGAEEGIIVSLESMTLAPVVTINFRERDERLV